jgi:hypothetical protein
MTRVRESARVHVVAEEHDDRALGVFSSTSRQRRDDRIFRRSVPAISNEEECDVDFRRRYDGYGDIG